MRQYTIRSRATYVLNEDWVVDGHDLEDAFNTVARLVRERGGDLDEMELVYEGGQVSAAEVLKEPHHGDQL